jgi:hypothetical protein
MNSKVPPLGVPCKGTNEVQGGLGAGVFTLTQTPACWPYGQETRLP